MRKKDYELIAGVLNMIGFANVTDETALKTVNKIALELAKQFNQNNPKFDIQKFLAACGIDTGLMADWTEAEHEAFDTANNS